jgi:phage gpG-like protein
MIEIKFDGENVIQALQQLQSKTANLGPALKEIGESLTESTKQRFVSTTDPHGKPWPLNSVLSTLLYEDGDRPLTGETGSLGDTIN